MKTLIYIKLVFKIVNHHVQNDVTEVTHEQRSALYFQRAVPT